MFHHFKVIIKKVFYKFLIMESKDDTFEEIQKVRKELPIFEYKDEIITLIKNNLVLVYFINTVYSSV